MTDSLSYYKSDDGEPVLTLNGEPVHPDARVTLAARDIAAFAHGGVEAAAKAGARAGVRAGTATRRIRKTIQRDEHGRIVGMLEEPDVPDEWLETA